MTASLVKWSEFLATDAEARATIRSDFAHLRKLIYLF
jgi:hypothetical protein